jgi:hypothetical protein
MINVVSIIVSLGIIGFNIGLFGLSCLSLLSVV